MPAPRVINPALRNEMEITDTSELDCIAMVETMPNSRLFQVLDVVRLSTRSSVPPVKAWKPCSSASMPKRKMATPAEITFRSGLIQKPPGEDQKNCWQKNVF